MDMSKLEINRDHGNGGFTRLKRAATRADHTEAIEQVLVHVRTLRAADIESLCLCVLPRQLNRDSNAVIAFGGDRTMIKLAIVELLLRFKRTLAQIDEEFSEKLMEELIAELRSTK